MEDLRIGILTCSDSRAEGAEDERGHAVISVCEERGWTVIAYHVSPDEAESISLSLIEMCDAEEADVVFTLGGTGLGCRDITPEATETVCERLVPGIAETIRHKAEDGDPAQTLSRATAGIRGNTLIVNLPGRESSTVRSLELLGDLLGPAVLQIKEG